MLPIFAALAVLGAVTSQAPPASAVREQCQRELALVEHIHRHVKAPMDGLSLAADRRDLERRGPGTAPAGPMGGGTSDVELLGRLSIVADLWYARVVERTPFVRMPHDRLQRLTDAQRAIGELQSRAAAGERDRFLPEMQSEVETLVRLASGGRADVLEADIDLALTIADQAAAGRPVMTYGAPPVSPGAYPTGPSAPMPPSPPPGAMPPPPPPPGVMPPTPPPSNGPTPYTLPPGYAQYAPPSAASATAAPAGCQTLRTAAGVQGSAAAMLRTASCWTGLQAFPGWMAQLEESLSWAETYAYLDRDCDALGTVIDRVREFGRPLTPNVKPEDLAAVAARAEADRRVLRTANRCR